MRKHFTVNMFMCTFTVGAWMCQNEKPKDEDGADHDKILTHDARVTQF